MTNDDLTDYVSDIRNHISPTTVVIDLDVKREPEMMSDVKQKYTVWAEKNGSYCGELEDGSIIGNDARLEFAGFEVGYQQQQAKIDELQKRINKALEVTSDFCDGDDIALMIYVLEKALQGTHEDFLSYSEIPNSSNQIINLDSMTSEQLKAISRVCTELIEESLKKQGLFSERSID